MKFDNNNIHFTSDLLVDAKLYHSFPTTFNDPFECKPHFHWPSSAEKVHLIKNHLIKVLMDEGSNLKEAKDLVSRKMSNPKFIQGIIYDAIQKNLSEIRICCFTKRKDNLLFWEHYADAHKGFCIEFDATKMPIVYAYKVKYSNDYPVISYPMPSDDTNFIPVLTKSKVWEYEEEFRTIFVPEASDQPDNNGEPLILRGNEIKNIYFGSDIDSLVKKKIITLIKNGPFNPNLWNCELSKSSIKLKFIKFS